MAHIGLIISGLTGRLHSSFELATKLQKEGHSITYLCPQNVKDKVENIGFKYVQLAPVNMGYNSENLKIIQASSWYKRCKYHFINYNKHHEKGKKILGLDKYKNKLATVNPDHIIIDMELHDLIFTATSLNIPVTLFTAWFSNRKGSGFKLPPLRTDIIPGKGIKGSALNIFTNWLFIKFKVQARIFANKLTFKDYRRTTLIEYAKTNGFPVKALIPSNLPHLFCYTNFPILSFTISEMDFPHKPAKNHIYIGPMIYEKRDSKFDQNTIKIIDTIINEKQKSGKKLIYFSAGSILVPEIDFILKIMKAIKNKENWLLIISLGGKLKKNEFKSQENCIFIPWVPQLKVLEHADCCITHAGINTINECLHYSVPMLVYSGNIADENGNAARIHHHKLGIMGNRHKDSSEVIGKHLDKILSNDYFQNNLNTFNNIYQGYKQKKISKYLKIES